MDETNHADTRRLSTWEDEQHDRNSKRYALNTLLSSTSDGRCSPVRSCLSENWDEVSDKQQRYYVRKAEEIFEAALMVLAPGQEDKLRDAVKRKGGFGTVTEAEVTHASKFGLRDAIVQAYIAADSWQTKRQILSLLVHQSSKKDLQQLIPGLSTWCIDQARRHTAETGAGQPVPHKPIVRTRLHPVKADHFIDFISSPTLLQDVAFGTKTLHLSTGEKLTIPATIRTTIPSRIVKMYKLHCTNTGFESASERTLYRILEACSASLQKSLQGLDNFTADGSGAFDKMQIIVDSLVNHGLVDKCWSQSVSERLKHGKNYLKLDFKSHVDKSDWCGDHCISYSLSDPKNEKHQSQCTHDHDLACERCEDLRNALSEINEKINNVRSHMTPEDLARLQFDYKHARKDIEEWKKHILRTINQEKAKHEILQILNEKTCLIIMDWPHNNGLTSIILYYILTIISAI